MYAVNSFRSRSLSLEEYNFISALTLEGGGTEAVCVLIFYQTRVRSLAMLVTNWLTDSRLVNLIGVTLACEDGKSKVATEQKEGLREAILTEALVARLQGFAELLCLVSKIFMLSFNSIGVVAEPVEEVPQYHHLPSPGWMLALQGWSGFCACKGCCWFYVDILK